VAPKPRVPYRSISASVLQGAVYILLVLHVVQDIKIQIFTTIVYVVYTQLLDTDDDAVGIEIRCSISIWI